MSMTESVPKKCVHANNNNLTHHKHLITPLENSDWFYQIDI